MSASKAGPAETVGEMRRTLSACKGALIGIAVLSGLLNVLFLTGSFYMLEVYDRVLPSGSVPTLVGLAMIALVLYAFQGIFDTVRGRLLARTGTMVDEMLSRRAFQAITRVPLVSASMDGLQPSRDLDAIRGFLSGAGPTAFFDLPWMPLYLAICFAFHPAIGWTATVGGLVLIGLTFLTDILSRKPVETVAQLTRDRYALSEIVRRNAEVLKAMGMESRLGLAWGRINGGLVEAQQRSADVQSTLGAASKVFRLLLQSAVLTVGAFLVINHQATGGIIIASSILTSRALAPVEQVIAQWKSFLTARKSWARLGALLERLPADADLLDLPAPCRQLSVENLAVGAPGSRTPFVQDASFRLAAGQGLGIVGPSASGKSSLVRAIIGAWVPAHGNVRLDAASIHHWVPDKLGVHVGYLPQDVQLFPGTVADNIARFDPDATAESIVAAARSAGVHEMILHLSDGYETAVGEHGLALSAGQRQRIGLARALYGNPFLVVLDEPNSNLDSQGEEALTQALFDVRARGGIAVVVAHRPSALTALDLVLVMNGGRVQAFGPRDEVLGRVLAPPPAAPGVAGRPKPSEITAESDRARAA